MKELRIKFKFSFMHILKTRVKDLSMNVVKVLNIILSCKNYSFMRVYVSV